MIIFPWKIQNIIRQTQALLETVGEFNLKITKRNELERLEYVEMVLNAVRLLSIVKYIKLYIDFNAFSFGAWIVRWYTNARDEITFRYIFAKRRFLNTKWTNLNKNNLYSTVHEPYDIFVLLCTRSGSV